MKQKLLDLLEKHVDKLVIGIIAITSLFFLWSFVISNPYGGEISARKFSPGKIDSKILANADRLKDMINGDATVTSRLYTGNQASVLDQLRESTVKINEKVVIKLADSSDVEVDVKRVYSKPDIPDVTNAVAESIRTAMFLPTEKIDMEQTYDDVETEVVDIDLVTVQASFDVAALYSNFEDSFLNAPSHEHRDENLAKPVFAAVALERQILGADDTWSDWQTLDRLIIDSYRQVFNIQPKADEKLLGGIDALVVDFDKFEIQKALLQPDPYDIAASNEEWMAPVSHKALVEYREKIAAETEKNTSGRGGRTKPVSYGGRRDRGTLGGRRPGATQPKRSQDAADIRKDFVDFVLLDEDLDMAAMADPMVFWAFDNDVNPNTTYRYRMRLGVFNPTAGKGWFAGEDAEFKDDVVLWSKYSDVTEQIAIEPMNYFFPVQVLRANKVVSIDVAKFYEGKWRTHNFDVRVGDTIGKVVEVKPERKPGEPVKRTRVVEKLKEVDFTTGAKLVKIAELKSATSRRPRYEIHYSVNDGPVEVLAVQQKQWPDEIKAAYKQVERDKDVEVVIREGRSGKGKMRMPGETNMPFEMPDGMMPPGMMPPGMIPGGF